MGNLPLAEHYLKAAWELRADGASGDHLGQLYEREHKLAEAVHMYNLALEASPDMTGTQARMRTLARVHLPEDRMSAAKELRSKNMTRRKEGLLVVLLHLGITAGFTALLWFDPFHDKMHDHAFLVGAIGGTLVMGAIQFVNELFIWLFGSGLY